MTHGKRTTKILVVDDNLEFAETVADGLEPHGFLGQAIASSKEALKLWERDRFDAMVTDLRMPELDGLQLLTQAKQIAPERPVIVMTAYGAVDTAVDAIRRGAHHYVTKPFKLEELAIFLRRAVDEARTQRHVRALQRTFGASSSRNNIVGASEAMRKVMDVLDRVAATDVSVLLTGPTGTGKGLLARTLHAESTRSDAPFVTVNCAAIPEALLESELFGHVKGAFTGATETKAGLFAEADDGTLFLDEIGEMSGALQAKLLDVLERQVIRPVGANKERPVNVRVVTATHRKLRELVAAGKFREDLLYRLDVVTIQVPALQERRDDIPLLVEFFVAQAKGRYPSSPVQRVSAQGMERLRCYAWPGNVRELAHTVERLVLLGNNVDIDRDDVAGALREAAPQHATFGDDVVSMRELQQRYAAWVLQRMDGHRTKSAEKLGIDMKTLAKLLES